MKKCAIYARVSSDKVASKSKSLEGQIIILQDYASKNNLKVYEIFEDYASCSSNRPAFSYMLEKIKQGKIKTVLCTDMSRVIRHFCDNDELHKLFNNSGVAVVSLFPDDNSEPQNYLVRQVQNALRQSERYNRSKVIKRGLRAKKLREREFANCT